MQPPRSNRPPPTIHVSLALALLVSAACTEAERGAADTTFTTDAAAETHAGDVPSETSDTLAPDAPEVIDPADVVPDSLATDSADLDADAHGDSDASADDWGAPGPYHVGYRAGSITYDANDGSGPRTLRLAIWYPTRATSGDPVLYLDVLPAPGVLGGAPPADDLASRPLVVFSHGNTSLAEQSAFLTAWLPTHGYVVAAPDHTGNTFGASFDVAVFHWRPADVSAVIDHMQSLPEGDLLAPLVGDDIAVVGHSFGGYTALTIGGAAWAVDAILTFCQTGAIPLGGCAALEAHTDLYRAGFLDARVDALVPMTPGATRVFGQSGTAAITLPTLLMTGARDKTTTNDAEGDPTWAQLATHAHNVRLDFATAGHFTFSDACSFPVDIGAGDGCGDGFIAPAAAHRAINAYTLAFLRVHLEGDARDAALLDGSVAIEPDVTLSRGATVALP